MLLGLYVHLPFCPRRCSYCDFLSLGPATAEVRERYLEALRREMAWWRDRLARQYPEVAVALVSVYLGGGTPTVLDISQLTGLLEDIGRYFVLMPGAEITLEANPGTVAAAGLRALRQAGVNRLSLGFQAWQDRHLAAMGRKYQVAQAVAAWEAARDSGFDNINIDLLYNFPGQTLADWQESLARTVALAPEHISCYGLELHPGTRWGRMAARGQLALPDEDLWEAMFNFTGAFLTAAGYAHYEIANYALPGRQCRHNQLYWRRRDYLGLGLGASSCGGRWRWRNTARLSSYLAALENGTLPVAISEKLDARQVLGEAIMLHLRLLQGADLAELGRRYGLPVEEYFGRQIQKLVEKGLLEKKAQRIRLAPRGLGVANLVFQEFI